VAALEKSTARPSGMDELITELKKEPGPANTEKILTLMKQIARK
jgi:hypothetical protein